jgi:hypothetical protein
MKAIKTFYMAAFLFAAFTLTSCSKDQKAVRHIDGNWGISELFYDGKYQENFDTKVVYRFEKCKQSKGDCNGQIIYKDSGIDNGVKWEYRNVQEFTYNVSEDGTKLNLTLTKETTTTKTNDKVETESDTCDLGCKLSFDLSLPQNNRVVLEKTDDNTKVTRITLSELSSIAHE